MRSGLFAFGVTLTISTQLLAQTLPLKNDSNGTYGGPHVAAPMIDCRPYELSNSFRIWGRSEYLLWWVKNTPMPVPLVTTGDPNDGFPLVNSAGAIGQPGTRVLFGGSDVGFGAFSGTRITLGSWLDCDGDVGIEGSGFLLERRTNQFAVRSDALGNPPLYFPAINVQAGAERAVPISDPRRQFSGDASVTSTLQLWGAEVNGVLNLWRSPGSDATFFAGFRYTDLAENLKIHNTTNDLAFFNTTVHNDQFGTRNQFYGGQIGGRATWQRDRLSVDVTGKVALGATHQVVNIQGNITQTGPGALILGTFPGGLYTQPTNIGRRTANEFGVLPAVELKVAYQITPRLRATAGYDFLYWNQVVRPGNQIDRNINQSQSPIFGNGVLVGQASPSPIFNRTDFWTQGVSFGLEFRY